MLYLLIKINFSTKKKRKKKFFTFCINYYFLLIFNLFSKSKINSNININILPIIKNYTIKNYYFLYLYN